MAAEGLELALHLGGELAGRRHDEGDRSGRRAIPLGHLDDPVRVLQGSELGEEIERHATRLAGVESARVWEPKPATVYSWGRA